MRRLTVIVALLAAAGLLLAAANDGDRGGSYLVRAIFDNGGFVVTDEEVRIAGAKVGVVDEVDVTRPGESVGKDGEVSGKAVVVLRIDDAGFQDFRADASCIIRPQSLIGEKYIDCTPTQPRAPGSEPPPALEEVPDGEPGEGQLLLPLENNGKAVDLDLVNNIMRKPYADRFRIILNDLGAGLAARGDDLAEIVRRANPALRTTDRVLKILAEQNRDLARLAADSDTVLEPLARERASVSGFVANAGQAAEAAAERRTDISASLERLPLFVRELRSTMSELRGLTDEAAPVAEDLERSAKPLSRTLKAFGPFSRAAVPALRTLGNAADQVGPDLVQADPLLVDLRGLGRQSEPAATSLGNLLRSLRRQRGFQNLMSMIFNLTASMNGFDSFGHYLRGNVLVSLCIEYAVVPFPGCPAVFSGGARSAPDAGPLARRAAREARAQRQAAQRSGGTAPGNRGNGNGKAGNGGNGLNGAEPLLGYLLEEGE